MGVTKKFGPLIENIRGQRIVLIDDSIVRGVTMTPIVNLLRAEGAKEVRYPYTTVVILQLFPLCCQLL